jgi:hypothetical protein
MSRTEPPDGQWADLRERITNAQDKETRRLITKARTDETLWRDDRSGAIH